jgi:hypothetical protein
MTEENLGLSPIFQWYSKAGVQGDGLAVGNSWKLTQVKQVK